MTHTPEQVLANLKAALPVIAQRINGGWDNIQAFTLKTNTSVALPVWSCSLDDKEIGRFALDKSQGDEPKKKRKREEDEKKASFLHHIAIIFNPYYLFVQGYRKGSGC